MSNLDKFTKLLDKHAENEDFTADEVKEQKKFRKQYPLSELDANLAVARMAVNFVRKHIPTAANHDQLLASSYEYQVFENGNNDVSKVNAADDCVYGKLRQSPDYKQNMGYGRSNFLEVQRLSRDAKCGNCYEQAAAAFMLLFRLNVRPLDYMWLAPWQLGLLDHSFVVIGRIPKSPIGVDKWEKDWGKNAVVCDPWAVGLHRSNSTPSKPSTFGDSYGAYPASQLGRKMKEMFSRFRTVEVKHSEA
jgi:hypothetical protein